MLYQCDDYGKDLLSGLPQGARREGAQADRADGRLRPDDVRRAVAGRAAEGERREHVLIFAFGKFAIQSFVYANKLGWKPQIYVNDVASASSIMQLNPQQTAEGTISILWGKDPGDAEVQERRGRRARGEDHQEVRARAGTRPTASSSPGWPRRSRSSTR